MAPDPTETPRWKVLNDPRTSANDTHRAQATCSALINIYSPLLHGYERRGKRPIKATINARTRRPSIDVRTLSGRGAKKTSRGFFDHLDGEERSLVFSRGCTIYGVTRRCGHSRNCNFWRNRTRFYPDERRGFLEIFRSNRYLREVYSFGAEVSRLVITERVRMKTIFAIFVYVTFGSRWVHF